MCCLLRPESKIVVRVDEESFATIDDREGFIRKSVVDVEENRPTDRLYGNHKEKREAREW
jgi:hypothetical protein